METGEKPYDLVLMDWRMRGIDGIEAARIIKNDARISPKPAIIIVTAFGRENVLKPAEAEGIIKTFILKPTSTSILFDTIIEVFGKEVVKTIKATISSNERLAKDTIRGAGVLLVEDNVINQQVATELLQSVGLQVDIANNGQEAVEAVGKSDYDIILMDIQMPVMSGYEATSLIRKDARFKDLPIVAMTAHAMSGMKNECLEKGMNDYVSKPIDPAQLFSVLTKWIKPGLRNAGETIQKCEIAKEQDAVFDFPASLTGIDIESGLNRVNGNRRLYKNLLLDFAKKYAAATEEIRKMITEGDIVTAERLAHTIKGIAGNISANSIQAAASEVEKGIKTKNIEAYDQLLSDLDQAMQPVLAAIKVLAREEKPLIKDMPINPLTIRPILKELARLLSKDDSKAEKSLELLKENIGSTMFTEEMKALDKHIGNFDFDLAINSLDRLAKAMNIPLER
jgi:CheY-like chemotaxis protein